MAGKFGVVPQRLEDAALERELRYLRDPCGDVPPWVAAGATEAHRAHPLARAGIPQPLTRLDPDRQPATRTGSRARAGQPPGRYPRPGTLR
jgi:hypothetical protein